VAFDFKKLITSVAPMIGSALGGPLVGAATITLLRKLGLEGKVDPEDEAAVQQAIIPLLNNPDILIKFKEADDEFRTTMHSLDINSEKDLEKLAVDDRASARQREIAVRDYTPEFGFYLLLGVFGFFLRWLCKYEIPAGSRDIVFYALGAITTLLTSAGNYFYGTTRSSSKKDAAIAESIPSDVVKQLAAYGSNGTKLLMSGNVAMKEESSK
jgi:hypothetical protein